MKNNTKINAHNPKEIIEFIFLKYRFSAFFHFKLEKMG